MNLLTKLHTKNAANVSKELLLDTQMNNSFDSKLLRHYILSAELE